MVPSRRPHGRRATVALLAALAGAAAHATDIAVPGDYPTIEIALANAVDGDRILLAPGLYPERVDLGTARVSIIGSGADLTTINAFSLGSVMRIAGGQGPDVVIENLTLTGGLADQGAGLFIDGASPTIRGVHVVGNTAMSPGADGGGVFAEASASSFTDCRFADNHAADRGGGVYSRIRTETSFLRCTFSNNVGRLGGGLAAYLANVTLAECTFEGNLAIGPDADGGGIHAEETTMSATRIRLTDNESDDDGAAILTRNSTLHLVTAWVTGNLSLGAGAIYAWDGGTVTVSNATMMENAAAAAPALSSSSGASIAFENGIIWNNDGGGGPVQGIQTRVRWSVIEGGDPDIGNLDVDPQLDADGRPLPGSPVIDAGTSAVIVAADPRDLDGLLRVRDDPDVVDTGVPIFGLVVDMGAYERQPASPDPTCPTDIDGDGAVTFSDLLAVLASFGACP